MRGEDATHPRQFLNPIKYKQMKKIFAKFTSTCAETGRRLKKGDSIFYDYTTRKAYHPEADAVKVWESKQEAESVSAYIDAQESAYFDRITGGYYSR